MFTFGYYSGAGALWNGNQNEEITVTAGFFILFTLLHELLNGIIGAIQTWHLVLLFVCLILFALILIWLVIASMNQGKTIARDNIKKLLKSGCVSKENGWNQCHQIWHKDKLIHEGYLVSKTSASVIMFKRDLQALEYITMPEGAMLRRQFSLPKEVSGSRSP